MGNKNRYYFQKGEEFELPMVLANSVPTWFRSRAETTFFASRLSYHLHWFQNWTARITAIPL